MVRLIFAIVSTLLEEAALLIIVLMGLPQLGIHVPLAGLIVLMVAWATISVIMYRLGSQALRKKPVIGLPSMIGGQGKVVNRLAPEGRIRIHGELWVARSSDNKEIDVDAEVIVVEQHGLTLIVCQRNHIG